MKLPNSSCSSTSRAFSLIELMTAMAILSVLLLMLTMMLDQVQRSWNYSENRIGQFREARVAFDLMAKNLAQASVNTYWDLEDENEDGIVDGYYRTSELHFLTMPATRLGNIGVQEPIGHAVFFQAPLGFSTEFPNLNSLFNGRGYLVTFGSDRNYRPSWLGSGEKFRYRLMEFRPPAEANQVFADGGEEREAGEPQQFTEWFRQGMNIGTGDFEDHLNPLAENVVSLIVSPRDSILTSAEKRNETSSRIAPDYEYDSSELGPGNEANINQVPPLVRLTMIAIDESSATRLEDGSSQPREIFRIIGSPFTSTRSYDDDIASLSAELDKERIGYKVFSALVLLRSARWSEG